MTSDALVHIRQYLTFQERYVQASAPLGFLLINPHVSSLGTVNGVPSGVTLR